MTAPARAPRTSRWARLDEHLADVALAVAVTLVIALVIATDPAGVSPAGGDRVRGGVRGAAAGPTAPARDRPDGDDPADLRLLRRRVPADRHGAARGGGPVLGRGDGPHRLGDRL